jgi:hypothetical protein
VFWIRDILVRIRILLFLSATFNMPTKNNFFVYKFNDYSLVKVHVHHSLKIKSHKEVTNSRNQDFPSFFLLVDGKQIIYNPDEDAEDPKTYGSGCGSGTLLLSSPFPIPSAPTCSATRRRTRKAASLRSGKGSLAMPASTLIG